MSETKPSVVEALSAVMGEVQAVKKDSRNTQQNFNFRGIDAVVNAVGPALRTHGVVVVPVATSWEPERYQTKSGAQMRGITLTVTFRFYGPAGDFIEAQACGESSDAGDKAMPKAHSVAYRTLLLQALCIPTDEPDPDVESHERGKETKPRAAKPKDVPSAAQRKELDDVIAELTDAKPDMDWAAGADKYARREFGHGVGALTVPELEQTVDAMRKHLDTIRAAA